MMTSLQLPPPRKTAPRAATNTNSGGKKAPAKNNKAHPEQQQSQSQSQPHPHPQVPSYEERCRAAAEASKLPKEQRPKLFVPRRVQDFGDDGGAFPEIHVAQYPRQMGNPHLLSKKRPAAKNAPGASQIAASTTKAIVNVQVDKDGQVSYDAIVKGGTNADKIVYSKLEDMQERQANAEDVALPTEEEEAAEAAKTQAALQALLSKKTALDKPSGSAMMHAENSQNLQSKTQFIQYTPRPDAPGYNPAAAQRVIQMVPAQVDPMMPPKHKHVKAPRGPAEDPVPVLHAPPTKLTKQERDQWNIPACISNWKNVRGYTIPLDKRLAADGRGLVEAEINSTNFAALSESLYVAEKQARQEVRLRAQTQKKLALQEKEDREKELRELAAKARLERSGAVAAVPAERIDALPASDESSVSPNEDDDSGEEEEHASGGGGTKNNKAETEDEVAARQREKLRLERKRERERELRLENSVEIKKQRLEEERDVSEKIALGVHTGTGGGQDTVDSRLYSQTAGMDSGFGAEDEYNAYSKPLFDRQPASAGSSIYRPTRGETDYNADEQYDRLKAGSKSKFQPDKGFGGAEGGMDVSAGPRTAPVQFEKAKK